MSIAYLCYFILLAANLYAKACASAKASATRGQRRRTEALWRGARKCSIIAVMKGVRLYCSHKEHDEIKK